jgi:hypothetical protein
MSARASLRAALADTYRCSLRLLVLNSLLSAVALAIVLAASYSPAALALVPLAGAPAAALMHCAIRLARTEELAFADALEGLRLHWRRGLALGAVLGAGLALAVLAIRFYADAGRSAWPVAALCSYLLALFCVYQLALWPLALAEPRIGLREAVREAGLTLLRRPLAALGLGLALLVVNVLGAVAIMPLLTLTVAYSFLAAAHFALPRPPTEEEVA